MDCMPWAHGCAGTAMSMDGLSSKIAPRQLLLHCSNKLHPCSDAFSAFPPVALTPPAFATLVHPCTSSMAVILVPDRVEEVRAKEFEAAIYLSKKWFKSSLVIAPLCSAVASNTPLTPILFSCLRSLIFRMPPAV